MRADEKGAFKVDALASWQYRIVGRNKSLELCDDFCMAFL